MNTSRTSRRALLTVAAATALIVPAVPGSPVSPDTASAAPGMVVNLDFRGCTGTQRTHSGNYVIASDRVSTGYCHWQTEAPAGTIATRAWVTNYGRDYSSTGARTLYVNGSDNCWGPGQAGDGIADGRRIENGFRSGGACIVMAQNRPVDYGRTVFTAVGNPQMYVEDAQGPAVSAPRISSGHTTAGWIRPANQPKVAPPAPVAAGPQPLAVTVEWDSSDNVAWRGQTGISLNGQPVGGEDRPNGTHRIDVSVTETTTISTWRAAPDWATASAGGASVAGMGARVDGTAPSLGQGTVTFEQGSSRVRAAWTASDAASGIAWSALELAPQGTANWTNLHYVPAGQATAASVAPDVTKFPDGVYLVRVVARDTAGNWQVMPLGTITISRPAPTVAPNTGDAGMGTAPGTTPSTGGAQAATSTPATPARSAARRTRYSIMAEFSKGNTRRTTFAAARKGLTITGELLDGYGDPVAGATIRIQQNTQKKNPRVWTTTTNADGEFTIRVATRTRGVLGATSDNVIRPVRLYVNG